jgi:methyl-accepting chemotaxis protein
VSDIASASAEQATGIEQVNKALTQMDEVTQQNSALVEENAATAKTLEHQAKAMDERVAFFQLGDAGQIEAAPVQRAAVGLPKSQPAAALRGGNGASRPKPTARPEPDAAPKRAAVRGGGPVGRMHAALATAIKSDPEWQEF